ncbi:sigma-70 family RNA polymerase sigma factor [Stieleria marina]|uniref:RNA polymerase sigma factor n=1 Tax=Stieleria marina TaxID=1930275 RepID=A0A517NU53_9BACT|nr:RNA polymerase sigma factor [Planctomycetes bacterium K23_9]
MNELSQTEEFAVEIAAIQPRLYGFILKRLADREQTLEVLQRTNLVLCRKLGDFQQGSSFTAWAFTIAKFQVMSWRKSNRSGRLVFSDQITDLLDRTAAEESQSVDDRIPVLRSCLERLRDDERDLIQRRYRDGEAIEPIALALSKSIDAIGMKLSRARKRLADCVRIGLNQEPEYEI